MDFKRIDELKVGYKLKRDTPNDPPHLHSVTFADFIPPYIKRAQSPKQVYDNLVYALGQARIQQDLVTNGKRSVSLDVLATATLEREAIMNSMKQIKKHYLE